MATWQVAGRILEATICWPARVQLWQLTGGHVAGIQCIKSFV